MSSDQGGEPQLQEEAEPGSKTRGEDETVLGTGGDSGSMVSVGLSLNFIVQSFIRNFGRSFYTTDDCPFGSRVILEECRLGQNFNVKLTFAG